MARITDAELERLKAGVPVAGLIEASGVALSRQGADLAGLCPFHADDTPSLKVTPGKNLWHCFGCGAGGGPIDWVMKRRGVSFRHAVELLREPAGMAENPTSFLAAASSTAPARLASPVSLDEDDAAVLGRVVDYYHACLKRSPAALAYLERRGIADPAAIETFKLGFADRTLGLRLPDKRRKEGAELRTRLERLGLYRASGHEHFTGSLVIPVFDAAGAVAEVYGRKITDNLRAGTPLHLYLPGPHRGVWNLPGIAAAPDGEVIVCEALIDALTFWCAGYRNVTASYGVDGFTEAHLAAFQQHAVRRVLIAYDRDEAGERGAAVLAERLSAAGIATGRVEFPHGMDANAYALKVTPAVKSLGVLLRRAGGTCAAAVPDLPAPEAEASEAAAKEENLAPTVAIPPVDAGATLASRALANDPPSSLAAALPAALPVPPAAAIPPAAADGPSTIPARPRPEIEANGTEATIRFASRRYRVRGLDRASGGESLKLNLTATTGEAFHVDTLDLYSAKARAAFTEAAAAELGIPAAAVKADLGQVLLAVEELLDARAAAAAKSAAPPEAAMTPAERDAALAFLRQPDLLDRITADFEACGLVGEATNKLVAYLACVSRKLAAPLAVLVQSSSAAGKSSLMDAVLAFVPEPERVRYSAMTGQALFYMGSRDLRHRVLALCEEEGASRAAYALKLLQSDGSLTIASTGKDPATGALVTQDYRVEGPVMLFLTTTAIELDEELLNRCLVLSVDEGRAQTEAIHRLQRQRRTLDGLLARQARGRILALHQNAQTLLAPLAVVNPYADRLTFLSDRTRARRDHEKYLTLIDAIALLHQHQRPIRRAEGSDLTYIEATIADIAHANRLTHEVLGRSLDALPPQSRRLLGLIADWIRERATTEGIARADVRFTRRALREATGWGDTQLKVHLSRLTELEHLLVHRAERGQGFVYELLYDGPPGDDGTAAPHLSGLIDPAALDASYDARRSGAEAGWSEPKADRSPVGRAVAGGGPVPGRSEAAAKAEAGSEAYQDTAESVPDSLFPAKARLNGSHRPAPVIASSLAAAPH
jgi:DNA primase catalytic core